MPRLRPDSLLHCFHARVAELADALGSGPSSRKGVEVRVLSRAPTYFGTPCRPEVQHRTPNSPGEHGVVSLFALDTCARRRSLARASSNACAAFGKPLQTQVEQVEGRAALASEFPTQEGMALKLVQEFPKTKNLLEVPQFSPGHHCFRSVPTFAPRNSAG
jgi:hypothetical protein